MTLLNKFGIGSDRGHHNDRSPSSGSKAHAAVAPVPSTGPARAPEQHVATRVSNGLKEFLWNLDGLGRGTLLDLGPAWQTTLNFFIERGFRVSSEDVLRGWREFLNEEEARLRAAGAAGNVLGGSSGNATGNHELDMTPGGRAVRFLTANLQYP